MVYNINQFIFVYHNIKNTMESAEDLTANERLDLITRMIQEAKGKVQKNSFYFLLWGWVIMIANLGMFILTQAGYTASYLVWTITIPAWLISIYWGARQEKAKGVSSHLGRVSTAMWISFGVVIFTLVAFGNKINFQLGPVIMLVSAIPTLASGVILRFRPLIVGGILFWMFGIVSFLLPREFQSLVGAIAITCSYLIPGYLLKNRKD